MAACGDLDELNCFLGAALAVLAQSGGDKKVRRFLEEAQKVISEAACALAAPGPISRLERQSLRAAESSLDETLENLSKGLKPLRGFVVPGGSPAAAWLHVARAVCRRAERAVVALSFKENIPGSLLVLMNRLSACLFVAARRVDPGSSAVV